ncbi:MAG: histidinol-phosphatase [Kiritimatiellae bacterium]|nr:histidinol-phosphatase [Kiritimatiellia bacterium]
MQPDDSLRQRYQLARELAAAAGRRTLDLFQNPRMQVELKADLSPVTAADRDAEQFLRERIAAAYPDDGIIGEEFGVREGTSPFRWILDPIDGTRSFVCGVPLYGTLIGLQRAGTSVAGVIELPALGESVHACRGAGAWHCLPGKAPRRAQVSKCSTLTEAVFVTSEIQTFHQRQAESVFDALERNCRVARTWGDCYGYALVATGRADIMIDAVMSVWDAAAILPVLEEAGGCFTDWSGRATVDSGEGVACNRDLLPQLLRVLGQA